MVTSSHIPFDRNGIKFCAPDGEILKEDELAISGWGWAGADFSAPTNAEAVKEIGLTHRPVNVCAGQRVVADVYHIQNVNAYDSRLKNWIRRFHGVATKYLDSYLGWFRTLDRSTGTALRPARLLEMAISV